MTFPKRICLFAANIIVPLNAGLFIYLTKSERTYLSDFLAFFRAKMPIIKYPALINSFACDFLWTYAMFFCIRISLGNELRGKHNLTVIILTGIVAIILESIQLIKGIPGTFDVFDLIVELIAIAVAILITNFIERRFNYYEEKSVS